jgi:uncharacterized flavoprotein (TIGR03862 family)
MPEPVAVVGGGPAGLRAAEILSGAGLEVTLYDRKPSVGRKFLIAGRGGLNLTHSEGPERFASRYAGSSSDSLWTSLLEDFGNDALRAWAAGLGVETFVGSSGRVFPKQLQSAQLLRRWVSRLRKQGVLFRSGHPWSGFRAVDDRFSLSFLSEGKEVTREHDRVILALGGASWPDTGSDGSWVPLLEGLGVRVEPWQAANCGWDVRWTEEFLRVAEGVPLKNIHASAAGRQVAGELMITRDGLEGGALYQLGPVLRGMERPELCIDLKPTFSSHELVIRMSGFSLRGASDQEVLRLAASRWRLGPAASALLSSFTPPEASGDPLLLAARAKSLPVPLLGPRPIAEAISSSGGVSFGELDDHLMIRKLPGLFLAGEMLDWEAPTGGYLLQGCFATGTRAARGMLRYLEK